MTDRPDAGRPTLVERLRAAEPETPRPLAGLVDRLRVEGRLTGSPLDPAERIATTRVNGITDDSRRLRPGDVFVAIRGAHADGHDHAAAALAAGAAAIVVERPVPQDVADGVQIIVDRGPAALAAAACWWYADPSLELGVVGVTGTDGKTTTSFLAAAALRVAGLPNGLVGTIETRVGGSRAVTDHVTTPGAIELQRILRAMVVAGDRAAVVETTSHGLAAERVAGTVYDAAIFTNLSHEHLEFHGSYDAYRAAKLSLFERLDASGPIKAGGWPRVGVVNHDDAESERFRAVTRRAGARLLTYGLDPAADVRATDVDEDAHRLRLAVAAPGWSGRLALRLAGRFNVHNALAVVALGIGWGLDPEAVREGLEGVSGVPGRMERVDRGQPFGVIVDFAHSPAALETVLDLLAPVARSQGGGLIVVFGSAGERDTAKRPMMGRVAGERCRLVVVTDEDPRGEDRSAILEEIALGAEATGRRRGSDLLLVADRAEAIATAFARARPGDLVLLAGKGHEQAIIGAAGPRPWDERAAAIEALAALGYGDRP